MLIIQMFEMPTLHFSACHETFAGAETRLRIVSSNRLFQITCSNI